MKRRLFLKSSSIGITGAIAIPSLLTGCGPWPPNGPGGATVGVGLFRDGSRMFDAAIAELRISGSGELASAEAEDVDLAGIAEQIKNQKAAVPAELAEDFAESSTDMLNASAELSESAPEVFPLSSGDSAELADDYALLKVVKASTLLAAAAMETPHPIRKVNAAEKMVDSAEFVHHAINSSSEAELIEATGHLLAHSEEYVGAAETFSAEAGFVAGVKEYAQAANHFLRSRHFSGAENLFTSTDNISLSSEYFGSGVGNLNAEAEYFNSALLTSSAEMIPSAAELVAESEIFLGLAEGASANMGAAEMVRGASEIHSDAETNVANIGNGGPLLDLGADQFIAGSITFVSANSMNRNAIKLFRASEDLGGWRDRSSEAEIEIATELLVPAAETFHRGAEALQHIELTGGVKSLVPTTQEIFRSAAELRDKARSAESRIGAAEMLRGAAMAEMGAAEAAAEPSEFLELGAEHVELGSFDIMNGAAEFIEGYR